MLSAEPGGHRFIWDLREERPIVSKYEFSIAAVDGEDTPRLPEGMLVRPGIYQVALIASGREQVKPLRVEADPRMAVDRAALDGALALSREIVAALKRHAEVDRELREVRRQLDAVTGEHAKDAIEAFKTRFAPFAARDVADAPNLDAIGGALQNLQIDLEGADRAPTQPQRDAFAFQAARLDRALTLWQELVSRDLPVLNAALRTAGLSEIAVR
jgi:hypothetical protein